MIRNAGEDFDLGENRQILQIDSPRARINGPYVVVIKDVDERWAIVALDWDGKKPELGFRRFYNKSGFPCSKGGYASWIILPDSLSRIILQGAVHKLSQTRIKLVEDFLDGKIDGQKLETEF